VPAIDLLVVGGHQLYPGWPFGPSKDTLAARGRPNLVVAYGHNIMEFSDFKGRI